MSGGAFEYKQHNIEEIASEIEQVLADIANPRPPQKTVHYVSVKKQTGQGCFLYEGWSYRCDSIESAKHMLRKHTKEENGHIYDLYDTWTDSDGNKHRCEYFITEGDYEDWADVYEDTCYYGPEYSKRTLAKFRKAIEVLREAYVYAQRIDWLLCGDDGEDTFHERLKHDLDKLKHSNNGTE